jgi:glutamine synthetase
MIVLNTAVGAQLIEFKTAVDAKIASGIAKEKAIFEVLKEYIKISKPIRFDGNGYSEEWKIEAAKRGLDCETSVPEILKAYTSDSSVELFTKTGVLSETELHARNEVKWETYTKKIQIEARVLGDLCMNHIIPVVTKYQSLLIDNVSKLFTIYSTEKANELGAMNKALIEEISERLSNVKANVDAMIEARKLANKIEHEYDKAVAYHDIIFPYFDIIRYDVDKLELIVDNELWPLPKYRELLFIR